MDPLLKELTKLEKLTAVHDRKPSIEQSLDDILKALHDLKAQYLAGNCSLDDLKQLASTVDAKKKEVDERQKEIYSVLARLGKILDKKFSSSLPQYQELFSSAGSVAALERTIALHLLRTGQFDVAETFLSESRITISDELRSQFVDLHQILKALRNHDILPALNWTKDHQKFLKSRGSVLEFHLHRSQYIRLLLSSHPPDPLPAIAYAKAHLSRFFKAHEAPNSVYRDLASPTLHFDLEPLFAKEYCASLGMSRQVPLRVVGDIGGGGALARIEKGRKVMGDRKGEWTQMEELPIEIALAVENRYHSTFACLVSKELSTESNPPMMMLCGHVISKDSLQKLNKSGGRSKCPYCPVETPVGPVGGALRIYL